MVPGYRNIAHLAAPSQGQLLRQCWGGGSSVGVFEASACSLSQRKDAQTGPFMGGVSEEDGDPQASEKGTVGA